MKVHKNTKLLPYHKNQIYKKYLNATSVTDLSEAYKVSRPTIL